MLAADAARRAAERHRGARGLARRSRHFRRRRGSRKAAEQQERRPTLPTGSRPSVIGVRVAWRVKAATVVAAKTVEQRACRPPLPTRARPNVIGERAAWRRHRGRRRRSRTAGHPARCCCRQAGGCVPTEPRGVAPESRRHSCLGGYRAVGPRAGGRRCQVCYRALSRARVPACQSRHHCRHRGSQAQPAIVQAATSARRVAA